jgi:hypothetical protein
MYEHFYTVPYEFDLENITESEIRDIIRRHYDFTRWCEENAIDKFQVEKHYNPRGITVSFKDEQDMLNFLDFSGNCYWIFMHN